MARVLDAIRSHRGGRLSCVEAGELLGLSERHFRRLRDAYEDRGEDGLIDRRRGRVSSTRVPDAEAEWLAKMFRTRYFDFTAKHFHEQVVGQPMADGQPFRRSYSCVKRVLQLRGLTTKAPRRGVHRRKRERRPLPGMMLFQDGSKHAWLDLGPDLDLIVTMDDATSAITSIFLCEEEGTASSFRGLSETIRGHGLFSSFYTDRGSHYFTTPAAGAKVDKTQPTQVGRALKQLNIDHIASYSPQARGRIERLWDTLQEASASAAQDERAHDDRGGQSLAGGGLHQPAQRPLRRGRHGGRHGLHSLRGRTRQHPVHRAGARRRPGQHRPLRRPLPTNSAQPQPASFRQEHHPGARILERRHRPVPRTARDRPLPFGRDPKPRVEGQERVCRVSPLRGEPVDGMDSFGTKRSEPAHPAHR
jgi:Helix-turn-helix domain